MEKLLLVKLDSDRQTDRHTDFLSLLLCLFYCLFLLELSSSEQSATLPKFHLSRSWKKRGLKIEEKLLRLSRVLLCASWKTFSCSEFVACGKSKEQLDCSNLILILVVFLTRLSFSYLRLSPLVDLLPPHPLSLSGFIYIRYCYSPCKRKKRSP